MKKSKLLKKIAVQFLILNFLTVSVSFATPKILDPSGPEHKVLQSVSDSLDSQGIDVILGKAKDFKTGVRPRLALLDGFRASEKVESWSEVSLDSWTRRFEEGLVGALVGVKKSANPVVRELERCDKLTDGEDIICSFLDAWINSAPENRIFVAFTKSDLASAEKVKKTLEIQGYTVFTYLRENSQDPWAHPDFVGAVFVQANHRLVIDSRYSRGSEGVRFESSICGDLLSNAREIKNDRWLEILNKYKTK